MFYFAQNVFHFITFSRNKNTHFIFINLVLKSIYENVFFSSLKRLHHTDTKTSLPKVTNPRYTTYYNLISNRMSDEINLGPGLIFWYDPNNEKGDMRFGAWNVRSLYRAGSLTAAARELVRYKVDLRWIFRKWDVGHGLD